MGQALCRALAGHPQGCNRQEGRARGFKVPSCCASGTSRLVAWLGGATRRPSAFCAPPPRLFHPNLTPPQLSQRRRSLPGELSLQLQRRLPVWGVLYRNRPHRRVGGMLAEISGGMLAEKQCPDSLVCARLAALTVVQLSLLIRQCAGGPQAILMPRPRTPTWDRPSQPQIQAPVCV